MYDLGIRRNFSYICIRPSIKFENWRPVASLVKSNPLFLLAFSQSWLDIFGDGRQNFEKRKRFPLLKIHKLLIYFYLSVFYAIFSETCFRFIKSQAIDLVIHMLKSPPLFF